VNHFLSILSTPQPRVLAMLARAIGLRTRPETVMAGKTLCCIFEKPSLRTRVSFEQAARRLGGHAMTLNQSEVGVGSRETPEDIARVLSGMVDVIMARVVAHDTLTRMAAVSAVPVINGLSELAHPAQALADALTMIDEFSPGDPAGVRGRTIAFVGDGNNVARSLAVVCGKLGMNFSICAPPGYELDDEWTSRVRRSMPDLNFHACTDPVEAVLHADAVYCDTFVSMGQESEKAQRLRVFAKYQVNMELMEPGPRPGGGGAGGPRRPGGGRPPAELMEQAPPHAIGLHCLPANRGVEISSEAMDGPRSRVFRQAHNRLDAQMGLIAELMAPTA